MIRRYGKRGFVLVMAAILLLSVTVIAAAFAYLVATRTRAAAADVNGAKALWLAEAGIQQVIYKVMNDSGYRDAPTTLTGNLGDGAYNVSVVKQAGKTVYDITSAGTVSGISRTLAQTVTYSVAGGWPDAFSKYGAFAVGGVVLQTNAKIAGDVYTLGTVTSSGKTSVTGTVYANSGSGNYTRLPLPSPGVSTPALGSTYYTTLINTAKTQTAGNKTYATLNLTGGTVYVNGTVTATNITGSGTVVSTGNFTVGGGTVAQNVTIVSGATVSFSSNSKVQAGGVLYAATGVTIPNAGVTINNSSLLTPGTVTFSNNVAFTGAIYCGGNFASTGSKAITITGAVVSGGTITFAKSDTLTQSANQLPTQVPNGIGNTSSITLSNWQEQ